MKDGTVRRYLLSFSVCSILISFFATVEQLHYYNNGNPFPLSPKINIIAQEFNQYVALQEFVNLERVFVLLAMCSAIVAFAFPRLRARKKLLCYALTGFSAIYLNLLYLWTSTTSFSSAVFRLLLFEARAFNALNFFSPVPSSGIQSVGPFVLADYLSMALLLATFLSILFAFGAQRSFQITSLLVLPLPLEIFLFDRVEFNLYVVSAFSQNPILVHFTNYALLLISSLTLVVSTLWRYRVPKIPMRTQYRDLRE